MDKSKEARFEDLVNTVRMMREEKEADATQIIKDLAKSYGGSNEEQGKMTQLLRGLAFSDDPASNKFMKALDKWTTEYANSMNESLELDEAKMSDKEVLAAAQKLAKNGKNEKTKKFGQGLVDFYEKNKSFTPEQVGGLQNIMKNASFQMAKEEVELDESRTKKYTTWNSKLTLGDRSVFKKTNKKDGSIEITGMFSSSRASELGGYTDWTVRVTVEPKKITFTLITKYHGRQALKSKKVRKVSYKTAQEAYDGENMTNMSLEDIKNAIR